jgi:hypothetical protein
MVKGFRAVLAAVIAIVACTYASAQVVEYSPTQGPPKHESSPVQTVMSLSYENFKNIKMLNAAIMNYGGGESELERLVDQYAEASAFFFQNKEDLAADKFLENEREILKVSQKLARKYKEDTEQLLNMGIKMNIRDSLKKGLKGDKSNAVAEKLLNNAQFGVQKANDYYDRYINATKASPRNLITSIYYYRRSKENLISMVEALDLDPETKKQILSQRKKDIEDNKNKIYLAKEKHNGFFASSENCKTEIALRKRRYFFFFRVLRACRRTFLSGWESSTMIFSRVSLSISYSLMALSAAQRTCTEGPGFHKNGGDQPVEALIAETHVIQGCDPNA